MVYHDQTIHCMMASNTRTSRSTCLTVEQASKSSSVEAHCNTLNRREPGSRGTPSTETSSHHTATIWLCKKWTAWEEAKDACRIYDSGCRVNAYIRNRSL